MDHGWKPYPNQVGLSGKTISPRLYVACGKSGAIQHLAGIQTVENIIAINSDPNAPIFQVADLAIVGNMFEILPVLTEEIHLLKETKARSSLFSEFTPGDFAGGEYFKNIGA